MKYCQLIQFLCRFSYIRSIKIGDVMRKIKYWIGVASKEHVEVGKHGGFSQLCHGKEAPLKRMKKGDWIIYYCPYLTLQNKEQYQKFSAVGKVIRDDVYPFEMAPGFIPFRKDVRFILNTNDVEIRPLINQLDFIADKNKWGNQFKYGHLEISKSDFIRIVQKMGAFSKSKMNSCHLLKEVLLEIQSGFAQLFHCVL